MRGPLQFNTVEVRHLMVLQHRSVTISTPQVAQGRGRGGRITNAGLAYARGFPTSKALMPKTGPSADFAVPPVTADRSKAPVANRELEELGVQLLRYQQAISGVSDIIQRNKHNIELGELLDAQEERARTLTAPGLVPAFSVIVRRETARAAGVVVPTIDIRCDRRMSWRLWESMAWNKEALLANQEACGREDARAAAKHRVEEFWLVREPSQLMKLAQYFRRH